MPLLSICIPTYERERDLLRCLESIFSLPINILTKLEVCVSDNCSNYDFIALMKSYSINKNLAFKRNLENIGFDRNVLEVLEMASSDFVMLLGNDDIILEDGILDLIIELECHRPDAVFSNYKINLTRSNETFLALTKYQTSHSLELEWVLKNVGDKCTFISALTFKKNNLVLDQKTIGKYIGKAFIHMALTFQSLENSKSIIYLNSPTVMAFDSNADIYDVKEVFLDKLGYIINSYKLKYKKTALTTFKLKILKYVVSSKNEIYLDDLFNFELLNIRSIILMILSKKIIFNVVLKFNILIRRVLNFFCYLT